MSQLLAQATSAVGGDLISTLLVMAPQMAFAIFVTYVYIKMNKEHAAEMKDIVEKFTISLDRTTDRFEKQQRELVDELRASARQDREQHARLFTDFASMAREVVVQLTSLRQEFLAAEPGHASLTPPETRHP